MGSNRERALQLRSRRLQYGVTDYLTAEHQRSDYLRPLIKTAYDQRQTLELRSGIYILFKGKKAVYVGQAKCFTRRIASHIGKKDFDTYGFIPCEQAALAQTEHLVITLLHPELNKMGGERRNGALLELKPLHFSRQSRRKAAQSGGI